MAAPLSREPRADFTALPASRAVARRRRLLVEAAWSVLLSRKTDTEELRSWAQRIALRRGMKTAIVALARRLAGILYAMWRDGTTFEPRRPVKGTAE